MKTEFTKSVEGKLYFVVFFLVSSFVAIVIYNFAVESIYAETTMNDFSKPVHRNIFNKTLN